MSKSGKFQLGFRETLIKPEEIG